MQAPHKFKYSISANSNAPQTTNTTQPTTKNSECVTSKRICNVLKLRFAKSDIL
jgi:hypothetical protein